MSSPTHSSLFAALAAAQAEFPTLLKDAENPHFRSKYAGLDTVVESSAPVLAKHGLAWIAKPSYDAEGRPTLKYTLAHGASGEREDGEMLLLLSKTDPQGQGSALTYARRYAQTSVLNLVADEDDDGNAAASGLVVKSKPKAKAKPKPAANGTIPEDEVGSLARLYAASGWKEPDAPDPHKTLRMQIGAVGAGNEGEIVDCIRALTVAQAVTVRSALQEARDA